MTPDQLGDLLSDLLELLGHFFLCGCYWIRLGQVINHACSPDAIVRPKFSPILPVQKSCWSDSVQAGMKLEDLFKYMDWL